MDNILKINKNLYKIMPNLHPLNSRQISNMNKFQLKSLLRIIFISLLLIFSIKSVDPIYSNLLSSVSIIMAVFTTHTCLNRNQKESTHD
jgi:hypothetical protein